MGNVLSLCGSLSDVFDEQGNPVAARIPFKAVVCAFSYAGCPSQTSNVKWSSEGGIAIAPPDGFELVDDGDAVAVKESGKYRVDLELLNTQGSNVYPNISVNGVAKLYGYGGGSGYRTANMTVVLELQALDKVTINLSNNGSGGMPFSTINQNSYHSLTFQKLATPTGASARRVVWGGGF